MRERGYVLHPQFRHSSPVRANLKRDDVGPSDFQLRVKENAKGFQSDAAILPGKELQRLAGRQAITVTVELVSIHTGLPAATATGDPFLERTGANHQYASVDFYLKGSYKAEHLSYCRVDRSGINPEILRALDQAGS
jgi:hypothetical protein